MRMRDFLFIELNAIFKEEHVALARLQSSIPRHNYNPFGCTSPANYFHALEN